MVRCLLAISLLVACTYVSLSQPPSDKKPAASDKMYGELTKAKADLAARQQALAVKHEEARVLRAQIIEARKATKQLNQAKAAIKPEEIDYSLFDRCPNGYSWYECNHEQEKAAWLAEQRASKAQKFAAATQKILDELFKRQAELQRSLAKLPSACSAYETDRLEQQRRIDEFEKQLKALTRVAFDEALNKSIGWLSKDFEVGSKGGVDTVSDGKKANGEPDPGGVSYGLYQMTSQTINPQTKQVTIGGTVQDFVNKYYKQEFAGLVPGTPAFTEKWKQIADADYKTFGERQHAYVKEMHYDPLTRSLSREVGFDASRQHKVVQSALWSAAVQHGPGNAAKIFAPVLRDSAGKTPQQILEALYDARTKFYPEGKSRYEKELQKAIKALEQGGPDD
ncbi:MAG: hypothetical protein RML93_11660 [Anaerolineales bacterium]|nr:hypothetical protein [Anaerolineales bacterium]MDW8447931.1 hypothetical protein [Anaerolineales bacterium]